MGPHNVIHEVLQESPLSPQRPEGERFDPPAGAFVSVFCAREPHLKRPATIPEPVFSGRRNHRYALTAQRRIQIHAANSFEKLLLQKPLLHPHERGIIILHGDNHRGLSNDPVPEFFWYGSEVHTHPANNHEQQPAGGELVPAGQHAFQQLEHISLLPALGRSKGLLGTKVFGRHSTLSPATNNNGTAGALPLSCDPGHTPAIQCRSTNTLGTWSITTDLAS